MRCSQCGSGYFRYHLMGVDCAACGLRMNLADMRQQRTVGLGKGASGMVIEDPAYDILLPMGTPPPAPDGDPLAKAYDPNEPRDEKGRWTTGGAHAAAPKATQLPSGTPAPQPGSIAWSQTNATNWQGDGYTVTRSTRLKGYQLRDPQGRFIGNVYPSRQAAQAAAQAHRTQTAAGTAPAPPAPPTAPPAPPPAAPAQPAAPQAPASPTGGSYLGLNFRHASTAKLAEEVHQRLGLTPNQIAQFMGVSPTTLEGMSHMLLVGTFNTVAQSKAQQYGISNPPQISAGWIAQAGQPAQPAAPAAPPQAPPAAPAQPAAPAAPPAPLQWVQPLNALGKPHATRWEATAPNGDKWALIRSTRLKAFLVEKNGTVLPGTHKDRVAAAAFVQSQVAAQPAQPAAPATPPPAAPAQPAAPQAPGAQPAWLNATAPGLPATASAQLMNALNAVLQQTGLTGPQVYNLWQQQGGKADWSVIDRMAQMVNQGAFVQAVQSMMHGAGLTPTPTAPAAPPAPPQAPAQPAQPATPPPYQPMKWRRVAGGSYAADGKDGRQYTAALQSGRWHLAVGGGNIGRYSSLKAAQAAADTHEELRQNPPPAPPDPLAASRPAWMPGPLQHNLGIALEHSAAIVEDLNQFDCGSTKTGNFGQPPRPMQLYVHSDSGVYGSIKVEGRDAQGNRITEQVRVSGGKRAQTTQRFAEITRLSGGSGWGSVRVTHIPTGGDTWFGALMTRLGADGPPKVADRAAVDKLIDGGAVAMYRLYNDNHGTLDGIHGAYATGDPMGVLSRQGTAYGHGIYNATNRVVAHSGDPAKARKLSEWDTIGNVLPYMRGNNHGITRSVLGPGAKTTTDAEAKTQMAQDKRELNRLLDQEFNGAKSKLIAHLAAQAQGAPASPQHDLGWQHAPHISQRSYTADSSRWAGNQWSSGFSTKVGGYFLFFGGKPVLDPDRTGRRMVFTSEADAHDFAKTLENHPTAQPLPALTGNGNDAVDFGVSKVQVNQGVGNQYANAPEMKQLQEWYQQRQTDIDKICSDQGYWALAAGYDGVWCNGNTMGNRHGGSQANYFMQLRRNNLVVQDKVIVQGSHDYQTYQRR